MKNEKQKNKISKMIVRVYTDKEGRVVIQYTLPGLLLRAQIIEKLISQHSHN